MSLVSFQFDSFVESPLREYTESQLHERIGSGGQIELPDVLEAFDWKRAWLPRNGDTITEDYGAPSSDRYDANGVIRQFLTITTTTEYKQNGATEYKKRLTVNRNRWVLATTDSSVTEVLVDRDWGEPVLSGTHTETVVNTNGSGSYSIEVTQTFTDYSPEWVKITTTAYSNEQSRETVWSDVLDLYAQAEWYLDASGDYILTRNAAGDAITTTDNYSGGWYVYPQYEGRTYFEISWGTYSGEVFQANGTRYKVRAAEWYIDTATVDLTGESGALLTREYIPQLPKLNANPYILTIEPDSVSPIYNRFPVIGKPFYGTDTIQPTDKDRPFTDDA